ncbi:MAG TPA: V-type ATP synthase subunit I [Methanomicrobiales archaeon]|nr:V-type ATP synthase subunit I [Methanomicrobiales archaeon]
MLRTKRMTRLLVTGLKERMEATIQELYRQHAFHIQEYVEGKDAEYQGFVLGKPLPGAGPVSLDLIRLRGVMSALGLAAGEGAAGGRPKAADVRSRMASEVPPVETEVEAIVTRRRDTLEPGTRRLGEEIATLEPFAEAPLDLEIYRGYESLAVYAGKAAHDVVVPFPHEKFFSSGVEGNFLALFVRAGDRAAAEALLQEARFQPLPVPEGTGSPRERLAKDREELARMNKELGEADRRLAEIRKEKGDLLLACEELLAVEAEQSEAPLRFATSGGAFVAEGWVPAGRVAAVREALIRASGGKVYVAEVEADPDDREIPVEYENPPFVRPTELITDLYARPRYSELDPTLLISLIFPIFFGLILGDVGYGALILAVTILVGRMFTQPDAKRLFTVLRNCSISSIIFGLLFSEFFGAELPWHPILFSRHLVIGEAGEGPNIVGLIVLSVWIAVAQLTLGRALSAVNHSHGHHGIRGVLGQLGWIATMWGILVLIWSIFPIPYMPDLTVFPAIVAGLSVTGIAGIVLILLGIVFIGMESPLELIELPSIVSNAMSYARLAAVGLSSVVIAIVINYIAIGKLIQPSLAHLSIVGIIMILLGVAVLLGGHLLNTALGLLGGGLQSLRLQYVEFFTKFYKGGGKKYRPFGMEKKYSED